MIKILVLATLVAIVHGGGRTLDETESLKILRMFRRHCGKGSSGGQVGNTFFYCKLSPETFKETKDYERELRSDDSPQQVVFVRPPSYEYTHNVALIGAAGRPQETSIYVLPSVSKHSLEFVDQRRGDFEARKPSLYFLTGSQGSVRTPEEPKVPEKDPIDIRADIPQTTEYAYDFTPTLPYFEPTETTFVPIQRSMTYDLRGPPNVRVSPVPTASVIS